MPYPTSIRWGDSMRRWCASLVLASVAIGLAAESTAALAAPGCTLVKVADWPVRVSAGNKLLIDGAINGQRIDVALDTGAMRSLILRSEALRLGLKPSRVWWAQMSGVGGQTE